MKDMIYVVIEGMRGTYDDLKDLKLGYSLFAFSLLIVFACSGYNALMSQSFYESKIGDFWFAFHLSMVITTLFAIAFFFACNFTTDFLIDWFKKRAGDRDGFYFLLVFTLTITLMVIDIKVNQHGIDPLAKMSTNYYATDQTSQVFNEWMAKVTETENEIAKLLNPYSWCMKHGHRHKLHPVDGDKLGYRCSSNEVIFKAKPKYGIPASRYHADFTTWKKLKEQVDEYRSLATAKAKSATEEYETGKVRLLHFPKFQKRNPYQRYTYQLYDHSFT